MCQRRIAYRSVFGVPGPVARLIVGCEMLKRATSKDGTTNVTKSTNECTNKQPLGFLPSVE